MSFLLLFPQPFAQSATLLVKNAAAGSHRQHLVGWVLEKVFACRTPNRCMTSLAVSWTPRVHWSWCRLRRSLHTHFIFCEQVGRKVLEHDDALLCEPLGLKHWEFVSPTCVCGYLLEADHVRPLCHVLTHRLENSRDAAGHFHSCNVLGFFRNFDKPLFPFVLALSPLNHRFLKLLYCLEVGQSLIGNPRDWEGCNSLQKSQAVLFRDERRCFPQLAVEKCVDRSGRSYEVCPFGGWGCCWCCCTRSHTSSHQVQGIVDVLEGFHVRQTDFAHEGGCCVMHHQLAVVVSRNFKREVEGRHGGRGGGYGRIAFAENRPWSLGDHRDQLMFVLLETFLVFSGKDPSQCEAAEDVHDLLHSSVRRWENIVAFVIADPLHKGVVQKIPRGDSRKAWTSQPEPSISPPRSQIVQRCFVCIFSRICTLQEFFFKVFQIVNLAGCLRKAEKQNCENQKSPHFENCCLQYLVQNRIVQRGSKTFLLGSSFDKSDTLCLVTLWTRQRSETDLSIHHISQSKRIPRVP